MSDPRKTAVNVLLKIEKEGAYSNITLNETLKLGEFTKNDKALVSALVYGVLDRKITLDFVLSKFIKMPLKKTAPFTLCVLRVALYQIMYMDKIPHSAAVNEAVKIIKKSREGRNSGFVNGVLRSVLREGAVLPKGNSKESLSIKYSCPLWIIESFIKDYGEENTKYLLEHSLKTPPVTARINTIKTDKNSLCEELSENGIEFSDGLCENSLIFKSGIDISGNEAYKKGEFYIQDSASQKAVSVLAPKKGDRVLDMCAAPGGKSFTMAQLMENCGEIIAGDLYEHRVGLIEKSAARLGVDIIKTRVLDASVYHKDLGLFDCVLCDVPCSGLGVLRRKPEIKYNKTEDFSELEALQYSILCNAVKYLKKDGRILYSTCTLRKNENENIVNRFLGEHKEFGRVNEETFMPHTHGTDGFYCALLQKKE